jgi:hypothetical protein
LMVLKDRVRALRPLFVPPDPCDRVEYAPGEVAQCDLWFQPPRSRSAPGQSDRQPASELEKHRSRLWESNPRLTHYEDDGRYPRHSHQH